MKILRDFLRHQADTDEMRDNAHRADRPYATLTPIVPIRFDPSDSWFGGKPRLPKNIGWPERKGTPLHFACQINLSRLPAGTWSGVGPREGWLAVFLHPETHHPQVLHVRGELEERDGPGQMVAEWARTNAYYAARTDLLPRWPVRIDERRDALSSTVDASGRYGPLFKDEKPDLANAAIHPFDKTTLAVLLDGLEEFFVRQVKDLCRFPAMKKIRDDDLQWMRETKALAFQSLEEFYKVEGVLAPGRYNFDLEKVASTLPKIANLPTYELDYLKDDDAGNCCFAYRRASLGELPVIARSLPMWWDRYASRLYWDCVNAYTSDPARLHRPLRERMERIWLHETQGFHGAMGHAPGGHIYTPHGPDTDTEILLELPTSRMQGWIWGDVYSIVLTIKRKALSRGNFAEVLWEITN
jgi:hypothetical protein